MDLLKVIGVAIVTTFSVMMLKPTKPEIAAVVSIAGGLVVLLMLTDALGTVFSSFSKIAERSGIESGMFSALLKILGIGYITEFASGTCADAGNSSMAQKVLIAGKIIILVLSLPIINSLLDIITGILP